MALNAEKLARELSGRKGTDVLSETKGCRGKRRFPSKKQARSRSRVIMSGNSICLRAYKCKHCKGWHLTKQRG